MVIAITGGIGSGKSTAIEVIKGLGYTVISADQTYKELLNDQTFVNFYHCNFNNVGGTSLKWHIHRRALAKTS